MHSPIPVIGIPANVLLCENGGEYLSAQIFTMKNNTLTALALAALITTTAFAADQWKKPLQQQLPLLGHRNWIVVADSAYPLQTAPGIETIYVKADHLKVVSGVIAELAKTRHVQPIIYTDAELEYVAEANAPGISAYRDTLAKVLTNQPVRLLPHEQIIGKLDTAGQTFKVLIIKTPLAQPYTAVFFELECGYWNQQAEKELRQGISTGAKAKSP